MSSSHNPLPESPPLAAPPAAPAPPARDPVWTGWDVFMIPVVTVLGIFVIGSGIGILMTVTRHRVPLGTPAALKLVLLSQALSYLLVVWFMHQLVERQYHVRFLDAVRWRWPQPGLWFGYLAMGVLLAIAVQLGSLLLPFPRSLPIDRYFQDTTAAYLMSFFGVTMAPLVEELFFRGFLYPVLARRVGMAIGALLTAASFALMHASQIAHAWAPLLVLFLVGLVLTLVRILTRAVAPGFLIHVGYNATLFTILYLATDHFHHMERMLP